jgi:DNA modification methylase
MQTNHKILVADSRNLNNIDSQSVDLVVTSPPYPMIQMWDELFSELSPSARAHLQNENGNDAFEAMHLELDKVWSELYRVMKEGAFACINIGDATRSVGDRFQLYPNHARIIVSFLKIGFDALPVVLWRKQTNAPNKFMGSGMLPAGAYVTLEHEYVLIFRKGAKRKFMFESDKNERMRSSFFWEERNKWFSDLWDFKGTSQGLNNTELRGRSAAFPFELAYRLINMYSLYGDTVLDPFLGTGTTTLSAIACGRNSIGVEIDRSFSPFVIEQSKSCIEMANALLADRIENHNVFVKSYGATKGGLKYFNSHHGFAVMTKQETDIQLYKLSTISEKAGSELFAAYEPIGMLSTDAETKEQIAIIRNDSSHQMSLAI